MSGYYNHSMSNNAVAAYDNGEMPYSKWTKSSIIDVAKKYDISQEKIDLLEKTHAKELKHLLCLSGWHHTSKYFNKTYFYQVDEDILINSSLEELSGLLKPEKQKKPRQTSNKRRCVLF